MSLLRSTRYALLAGSLLGFGAAQAAVTAYVPGGNDDPRIRSARFLGENKQHLSALIELLRAEADAAQPQATQFGWLVADNYIKFGLRDRANGAYDALRTLSADPIQFGRAQLTMAEFEYTRGYLPEARSRLLQMRESLPKELFLDWQELLSKVLITQGRDSDAIDLLIDPKNGDDQSQYTRYNLGIALIRDGRTEQGRTILDRVGSIDPTDRDTLALRDKANLTLGWNFLQERQGGAAKPILRRVRVEGPYSNRALLGLGWAELLPDGDRQRRRNLDDGSSDGFRDPFVSFSTLGVLLRRGQNNEQQLPQRSFRQIRAAGDQEVAMTRALDAWLLLVDRDPQDPAVQEGWLAIPYALDQVGAHDQARTFYEQAIERLEAARVRTDKAIEALKGNRMIDTIVKREVDAESGWDWELKDLPDAPETYYLQTLLAEHRFSEALKNYRDARLLLRNLDSWEKRLNDLERSYSNPGRASVDTGALFERASLNHVELRPVDGIALRTETTLAAPGHYRDAPYVAPPGPPQLKLAEPPAAFGGTYEQIGQLRHRLASLRPALSNMADEQASFLRDMGTTELSAQKTLIERYLVEARFALARLYDRQPGFSEPDEYEIKK